MTSEQVPLKYEKIEPYSLIRGDIILHEGQLWQCALKNASLFLNLESKQQKQINRQWYLRVSRLELIPHEWKFVEGKVQLKGQELGLGPIHSIDLQGMRSFEEMQIVKSQAQKGRKVDYKIIAVQTQQKSKYLLVAIQFLEQAHPMHNLSAHSKDRFKHHPPQKTNTFIRSNANKQKRLKETILLLLHQEKVFECQNNRQMIINSQISKSRKQSAERSKFQTNVKQTFYEKAITLTPKFKKLNLSQSKLPPLNRKCKKQLKQQFGTLTPWQQQDSVNLMRPLSSKLLPY